MKKVSDFGGSYKIELNVIGVANFLHSIEAMVTAELANNQESDNLIAISFMFMTDKNLCAVSSMSPKTKDIVIKKDFASLYYAEFGKDCDVKFIDKNIPEKTKWKNVVEEFPSVEFIYDRISFCVTQKSAQEIKDQCQSILSFLFEKYKTPEGYFDIDAASFEQYRIVFEKYYEVRDNVTMCDINIRLDRSLVQTEEPFIKKSYRANNGNVRIIEAFELSVINSVENIFDKRVKGTKPCYCFDANSFFSVIKNEKLIKNLHLLVDVDAQTTNSSNDSCMFFSQINNYNPEIKFFAPYQTEKKTILTDDMLSVFHNVAMSNAGNIADDETSKSIGAFTNHFAFVISDNDLVFETNRISYLIDNSQGLPIVTAFIYNYESVVGIEEKIRNIGHTIEKITEKIIKSADSEKICDAENVRSYLIEHNVPKHSRIFCKKFMESFENECRVFTKKEKYVACLHKDFAMIINAKEKDS